MTASRRLSIATQGFRGGDGGGTVYVGASLEGNINLDARGSLSSGLDADLSGSILQGDLSALEGAIATNTLEADLCLT